MTNPSNYSMLISKLDQFIRKYYINQIMRGSLFCIALCVAVFLLYTSFEGQFYFSQGIRKALMISFIIVLFGSLGYWVLLPVLKYFKLGRRISHERAAIILGRHFDDVEDKLVNILQLRASTSEFDQKALIEASINKKAESIKLVPFRQAIDLKKNRQHLRFAMPPLLILLFLLFAAPSLVQKGAYRIINNDRDFEREAPFHFVFSQDEFSVLEFDDFKLEVEADGQYLPNEAFIRVGNYEYRMNKTGPSTFSYLFPNVREDVKFEVYSGRYGSKSQELNVLARPKIMDFKLSAQYPGYTLRRAETLANVGDITVPEGTKLKWNFNVLETDEMGISFSGEEEIPIQKDGNASFVYDKRVVSDENYRVTLRNENLPEGSSLAYNIRSIRDQFPDIEVESFEDSLEANIYYFIGNAHDDYGLTKLQFVYERVLEDGSIAGRSQEVIPFQIGPSTNYEFILDIDQYDLSPGEKMNYFFEVFDNDGVNGSKSSKTSVMSFKRKSLEEVKMEEEANEEQIKENLEDNIEEARDIQDELNKLREKLLQKEEPDWQDKKDLENLLNRQKDLQRKLEESKNAHEQNLQNQQDFMNLSPEMMEKQERIQELFEELVSDEMQNLMEQIQELMQELNKEMSLQMMEEFKTSEEALENEMERLAELYKQLEVEKEMNEAVDKLNELAERLDELSKETAEKEEDSQEPDSEDSDDQNEDSDDQNEDSDDQNEDSEEQSEDSENQNEDSEGQKEDLEEKQEAINEEFNELQEKMKETIEKNDELEFPQEIRDDTPEQLEDIEQDLEQSQESLQQKQNSKASQSQKKASQKMKNMAQGMQQEMQAGQEEQMQEDLETLRQLLENLVTLSFDQEGLITSINRTTINTPRYISLLQDQMKIKDEFRVVEDTLQALAKRQPNIESYVLEKVSEVKSNLASGLDQLEDRKKPEANQSQRTTMKNLNDLALMLSETMEQMQQQMSQMMPGSQMCNNPGQKQGQGQRGRVPRDKITEGQEQLSDDLKKMQNSAREGKGNSAKEFANAAAKQAALRKALEEMQREQEEQGGGISDQLREIIEEMDKQEVDLVNKKLDNEMLLRQQDILTRLLEAEKAQKEREFDNKRKSEEAGEIPREFPPSLQEYLKERNAQLEQYKYVSPELRPHYKRLVDEYYKRLNRA